MFFEDLMAEARVNLKVHGARGLAFMSSTPEEHVIVVKTVSFYVTDAIAFPRPRSRNV